MTVLMTEELVEFLDRAIVAIVGTRDANLVPNVHRVSGWYTANDRSTITCAIADAFATNLLSCLEDNGQLALTVSEIPSHETYQFKGTFVASRGVDEHDLAHANRHRQQFVDRVGAVFRFSEAALRAYMPVPNLAVTFAVREIFFQTPGPRAGQRLMPPLS